MAAAGEGPLPAEPPAAFHAHGPPVGHQGAGDDRRLDFAGRYLGENLPAHFLGRHPHRPEGCGGKDHGHPTHRRAGRGQGFDDLGGSHRVGVHTAVLPAGQQVEETGVVQPLRQPVRDAAGVVHLIGGGGDFGEHGLGCGQQVMGGCKAGALLCSAHTLPPLSEL